MNIIKLQVGRVLFVDTYKENMFINYLNNASPKVETQRYSITGTSTEN